MSLIRHANLLKSPAERYGATHLVGPKNGSLVYAACGKKFSIDDSFGTIEFVEEDAPSCRDCTALLANPEGQAARIEGIVRVEQASAVIQAELVIRAKRAELELLFAEEVLEKIVALHVPELGSGNCHECGAALPCPTLRAIENRGRVWRAGE